MNKKDFHNEEFHSVENEISEWLELELTPEKRITKGSNNFSIPQLKGWLALGKPLFNKINFSSDSIDQENFDFFHVLLAVSFRPEEGKYFDKVWVQVELKTDDSKKEAIAWSMHPNKEATRIDITQKVGVNGKACLKWLSSETKTEKESKLTEQEYYLVAYNEMCSNPVWEFIKTKQVPILGSHRLHLVIRKETGINVFVSVSVIATVNYKRFGLFTYKSTIKDTPTLSFDIK